MFDGKQFGQEIVGIVKSHVEKTVAPLLSQIEVMRKEIDALKAVPPPKDGKDADPMEVAAIVDANFKDDLAEIRSAFSAIPVPIELPDIPAMIKEAVETSEVWMRKEIGDGIATAIATLPTAEKGRDADPVEVAAQLAAEVERAVAALPASQDGKDGAPGEKGADGLSGLNGKDGLDAMDVMVDREGALVFTMSDGRMKNVGLVVGKDGVPGKDGNDGAAGLNGKDGADAVGFDDMDLVETEQGIMLRFTRGDVVKDFRLPIVTDRGVFKEGTEYRKGDGVTWGGSFFIAQETTSEKPDSGKGFRLAVKRGRDGKDGQMKPAREIAPVKVG